MKYIFIIFRNNFRKSTLGNFGKSNVYGKIKIISLSGRIKSIFGKILYFFKIGKFISADGDPFLKDKNISINLWFTGTSLRITKEFKKYQNNFVNMNNPIITQEKKIFQIFPIIKKKNSIRSNPKIVFMGKIFFEPKKGDLINLDLLETKKKDLLNDFSQIDNLEFWQQFNQNDDTINFENYRIIKTFLREKIIIEIMKNFKDNFLIYGQNLKNDNIKFLDPIFSLNKISKIYNGNLCLDTGSIMGSLSLYPRSIQIIESGGLLLQTQQTDSENIWDNLSQKIISNNIEKLLTDLESFLSSTKKCNDTLEQIETKFKNSKKDTEVLLKKIFY